MGGQARGWSALAKDLSAAGLAAKAGESLECDSRLPRRRTDGLAAAGRWEQPVHNFQLVGALRSGGSRDTACRTGITSRGAEVRTQTASVGALRSLGSDGHAWRYPGTIALERRQIPRPSPRPCKGAERSHGCICHKGEESCWRQTVLATHEFGLNWPVNGRWSYLATLRIQACARGHMHDLALNLRHKMAALPMTLVLLGCICSSTWHALASEIPQGIATVAMSLRARQRRMYQAAHFEK